MMPEQPEREPGRLDDRKYEAPALTDLGAVDRFSQGDTQISIDDE